jgi:exopolysaccharide production negative regulator
LFATRTSRARLGLVAAGLLLASAHAAAAGIKFRSADDALDQGLSAYNGGYYELAIPALEFAAASNHFLAQYYLALVFADNATAHTDHAKAYILFQRIANEHAEADPEDDQRAKYVAKALTVLAGYLQRGLPEIGLKPDAHRAAEYLHHAAVFFNHPDAQFELAKLHLASGDSPSDIAQAKHWLSRLSQNGHAGAQAFLADLLWRGKFLERDGVRALALIAVAVENAPPADRVWIEDIYQNVYCGASSSTRTQATGLVADWRDRYGKKPDIRDRSGLAALSAAATRTCQDGEPVVPFKAGTLEADASQGSAKVGAPDVMRGIPEAVRETGATPPPQAR